MTRRNLTDRNVILLYYDGFEKKATINTARRIRNYFHGKARHCYRLITGRQLYTGYYTAFLYLKKGLKNHGFTVKVNDFNAALKNPDQPIILCGYRSVFKAVCLQNPALAFHSDFGSPDEVQEITRNNNIVIYSAACDWLCALYRARLGARVRPLFVGIDTQAWPVLSDHQKDMDFLVYDKIRFQRSTNKPRVLDPILATLGSHGYRFHVIRYGEHGLSQFRESLRRSRAMVFVAEHETQGLAYQEALASGVPVLAWDEGELADPNQLPYLPPGVRVSSVPYFDDRCGIRFKLDEFDHKLAEFVKKLPDFRPRDFVEKTLSLEAGTDAFLRLYREVAGEAGRDPR